MRVKDPWHIENIQRKSEYIKQLRAKMLIHSCIYYQLNSNIVDDHTWQQWADDLEQVQKEYPHLCKIDFYDEYFIDWTGTTGNHLPHTDPWVFNKAVYILNKHKGK